MGLKVFWHKPEKVYKDPEYLRWVHENQKCLVCGSNDIELHHCKDKSIKGRDDRYVLALCPNHHRCSELSPHGTPKLFKERYPISAQIQTAHQLYETYKEFK